MKHDFPSVSQEKLCALFGKSRRAIYDYQQRRQQEVFQEDIVLQLALQIRKYMPRLGTRKLHYKLQPLLLEHGISIGRDELFDLLKGHRLLIRQRKRKVITTNSRHWMHKYANLTKALSVNGPEQLWVSDITYIRMKGQWGYLSLITDAYSRKIMGYCFRTDMSAIGCVQALQMALSHRQYANERLVHHSDRGSQYCSSVYTDILSYHCIAVSMTENGDPYENALAERMNGIIKSEFNLYDSQQNFEATHERIGNSIEIYNTMRPHSSCNLLTPQQAHLQSGKLPQKWKTYPKKYPGSSTIMQDQTTQSSKREAGTAPFKERVPASLLTDP
jgi:putative transposase